MNWKETLASGAVTGLVLAIFFQINTLLGIGFESFAGFVIFTLGSIFFSPFIVKIGFTKSGIYEPSLKHLIPVSFLSFIIPIFGVSLGQPNSHISTVAAILLMAAIAGIFWSLPYLLWHYFRGKKDNDEDNHQGND